MEPRAINQGFASRGEGLARIAGPKWGKFRARRLPRVPDLQSLGRSSCRMGSVARRLLPKRLGKPPNADEIEMPEA